MCVCVCAIGVATVVCDPKVIVRNFLKTTTLNVIDTGVFIKEITTLGKNLIFVGLRYLNKLSG